MLLIPFGNCRMKLRCLFLWFWRIAFWTRADAAAFAAGWPSLTTAIAHHLAHFTHGFLHLLLGDFPIFVGVEPAELLLTDFLIIFLGNGSFFLHKAEDLAYATTHAAALSEAAGARATFWAW